MTFRNYSGSLSMSGSDRICRTPTPAPPLPPPAACAAAAAPPLLWPPLWATPRVPLFCGWEPRRRRCGRASYRAAVAEEQTSGCG